MKRTSHHAARRFGLENLESREMLTGARIAMAPVEPIVEDSSTEFRAASQSTSRGAAQQDPDDLEWEIEGPEASGPASRVDAVLAGG
jgi:hypothetical protein